MHRKGFFKEKASELRAGHREGVGQIGTGTGGGVEEALICASLEYGTKDCVGAGTQQWVGTEGMMCKEAGTSQILQGCPSQTRACGQCVPMWPACLLFSSQLSLVL